MKLLFFLILMVLPPRLTQMAGINAVNVLRNSNASQAMSSLLLEPLAHLLVVDEPRRDDFEGH